MIKAKLTTATGPKSRQKENVVVKLNVRKSLLQTLLACEVSPRRQLSLPSSRSAPAAPPPVVGKSPRWDAAVGLLMVQGLLRWLPNPAALWQLQPHFVRFSWHF